MRCSPLLSQLFGRPVQPPLPAESDVSAPPDGSQDAVAGPSSIKPPQSEAAQGASPPVPAIFNRGKQKSMLVGRRLGHALAQFHATQQTTLWCQLDLRDEKITEWRVLFYFETGNLASELQRAGLEHVEVEIDFPPSYPLTAPTVRLVSPKLRNILNGEAGIYGGSLCLDFLHNWTTQISEETLLAQVHLALSSGEIIEEASYTQREADVGQKYIRKVHTEWRARR